MTILPIVFFVLLYLFLVPAILTWLWNMTIPDIFGIKTIEYWQAFRLIIIAGILMGGGFINFN